MNMKRNLVLNGYPEQSEVPSEQSPAQPHQIPSNPIEKVTPNEGDCVCVVYPAV